MALVTTISGETSNSYVTLEEADLYFASHYLLALQTTWDALTDPQKDMLLRRGTQVIETLPLEDAGYYRNSYNQALTFPRNVDYNSAGDYSIPSNVKDSQCEQAIYLSTLDESMLSVQMQGVSEEEIGGDVTVRTKYSNGSGSLLAPMAFQLMQPYLRRGGGGKLRRA